MKKNKLLAWLLLVVMVMSLCPTAAIAEETDDHDHSEEVVALSEPASEPEEEPAEEPEPEVTETPVEEPATEPVVTEVPVEESAEESDEESAQPETEPETDEAVAAVAAMIDALPDAETADAATLAAAYDAAQDAADAFYALSGAQQDRVANLARLIALMEWFSAQVAPLDEETHNYDEGFCNRHKDCYQPATLNDDGYYEIGNAGQLFWFAQQVNDGQTSINGKLTADINLDNKPWTPIGSMSNNYTGTFDGGDHTISKLNVAASASGNVYAGLFGYVGTNADTTTTVKNVSVSGSVTATANGGNAYAGGIAGFAWYSTIQNCRSDCTVTASATKSDGAEALAGGIVGYTRYGTVERCVNTGSVSATASASGSSRFASANAYAGGIAGHSMADNTYPARIQNCYNTGSVSATDQTDKGSHNAGGIVGSNGADLTACYSTAASITGSGGTARIGGVAGYNGSVLSNCYYLSGKGFSDSVADGKDAAAFRSGEVTWLLNNGSTENPVWRQTCGTGYPELSITGAVVYQTAPCPSYTNTAGETKEHDFVDYVCTACAKEQHHHCLYGHENCTNTAHDGEILFEEWTDAGSLPTTAGNYCLTTDVAIDTTWSPANGTVLCLNGHIIKSAVSWGSPAIGLTSGITFTLTDCGTAGKITLSASGNHARCVKVESGATFLFYGGTITGWHFVSSNIDYGAGVYNDGTFTMYGGTITGCMAGLSGGGVYNNGVFTMYGGSITGNAAGYNLSGHAQADTNRTRYGGGVHNTASGTIALYGGTITNNKINASWQDGIWYSGDTIRNVYLDGEAKITVGANFSGTVGVTVNSGKEARGYRVLTLSEGASATGFTYDKKTYVFDADGKLACSHMNEDGTSAFDTTTRKCTICGEDCAHSSVDSTGKCTACGLQYVASVTSGNTTTYYTTFEDAVTKSNSYDSRAPIPELTLYTECQFSETQTFTRPVDIEPNGHKLTGDLKFSYTSSTGSSIEGTGTIAGDVTVEGNVVLQFYSGTGTQNLTGTLTVSQSAKAILKTGATVATLELQSGEAEVNGTVTTMNVSGGEAEVKRGTVTTMNVTGGTVTVTSYSQYAKAQVTNLTVSGGTVNVSELAQVTNLTATGGTLSISGGTVNTLWVQNAAAASGTSLSGGTYQAIKVYTNNGADVSDSNGNTVFLPDLLENGYAYSLNADVEEQSMTAGVQNWHGARAWDFTGYNGVTFSVVSHAHDYTSGTGAGMCACGAACPHPADEVSGPNTDDKYTCSDCEQTMTAKLEYTKDGATVTHYAIYASDLTRVIDSEAPAACTITLLDSNDFLTLSAEQNQTITLDLNRCSIGQQMSLSGAGTIAIADNSTDGTGEVEALDVQSSGTVKLRGGTYDSITIDNGAAEGETAKTIADLLDTGYAYQTARGGDPVTFADAKTRAQASEVKVVKCENHSIENGACKYCNTPVAARVTDSAGGNAVYYSDLKDAIDNVPTGGTITLLSNITQDNWTANGQRKINNGRTFTLDLNGKTISVQNGYDVSVADGTSVTITDSGTGGRMEDTLYLQTASLTVTGGSFKKLTVACMNVRTATLQGGSYDEIQISTKGRYKKISEVLAEDYGYCGLTSGAGENWLTGEKLEAASCTNVSVQKLPITGVTISSNSSNNNRYTYGDTVTLTATTTGVAANNTDNVVYSWEKILAEGKPSEPISGNGDTCSLENLDAGTYTYRVTATVEFYSVSAEIQVTVAEKPVTVTAPTALSGLTYNATAQALITAATAENCTIEYSLDNQTWAEAIPTGTNAEDYTIYWQVTPGANYCIAEDSQSGGQVENSIAKLALTNANTTIRKTGELTYTGAQQTQEITVTVSDTAIGFSATLEKGRDYTVTGNTATNAGDYTLTVSGTGNYSGKIEGVTWTIAPAKIEPIFELPGKTYDGTTTANVTLSSYTVLPAGQSLTADTDYTLTATYDDANVGIGKSVTIKLTLRNENYTFANGATSHQSVEQEGIINPKYVTADITVAEKKYDGKTDATVSAEVKQSDLIAGDSITISGLTGTFDTAQVGAAKTVTIDTSGMTITGTNVGNYNVIIPPTTRANITNGWNPAEGTEYTASKPNSNGWLKEDLTVTAKDGYELSLANTANGTWSATLTGSTEGDNSVLEFYVRDKHTGWISEKVTVDYKLDKNTEATATTGKVEFVGRTSWQEFLNTITFDLFYKDEVTVKATALDVLSGVDKIEYAASNEALSLEQVRNISDWTVMPEDGVGVTVADAKKFVYYIRVTDKAGNVSYFSTNGAVYDTALPAVSGIENGATYYTTQAVTVTDGNLKTVTLEIRETDSSAGNSSDKDISNGNSSAFTLEGDKARTYTITATDKAGNVTTYTVTMKPIAALTEAIADLTEANVTSDNLTDIEAAMAAIESELESTTATEAEKQALTAAKDNAQKLIDRVTAAAAAVATETIRATENITAENVKTRDKSALEAAKAELEKALEDFGGNYTVEQKAAIEASIERIEAALKAIEQLERAAQMKKAAQTGDRATPVLYIVVIVLALGAIVTIVVIRKKRQK